jgi:plastocyanin
MNKTMMVSILVLVLLVVGIYLIVHKGNNSVDNTVPVGQGDNVNNPAASTGGTKNTSSTPAAGTIVEGKAYVSMSNFAYSPKTITIKKGVTVVWTNDDAVEHTVTSDTGTMLNSEIIPVGSSFNYVFDKAGTYSYHCKIHPNMKGTVVVTN